MINKTYYLITLLIIVLSLALSILFFPAPEKSSLMLFYNKEYQKSYQEYEKLFQEGNHSIPVIMPLITLNLQRADPDRAIELMELFVRENPDSLDALQYLGKLYKDNRRPYEYLLNMEAIYRLHPTVENLREQLYLYTIFDDVPPQIEILKEIVRRYRPLETEYYQLSYYYAANGQMDLALAVLKQMLRQYHPAMLDYSTLLYVINLLAQNKEVKEAATLAERYIESDPNPQIAADFAFSFLEHGLIEEGLHILDWLPSYQQQTDLIFNTRALLLLADHQDQKAYHLLRIRFDAGLLKPSLIENLLILAIERRDSETISQIIRKAPLNQISESILVMLIEFSMERNEFGLIQKLALQLGDSYLQEHPFMSYILFLQRYAPSEEEESRLYAAPQQWTDTQKAILSRFYAFKGYRKAAKHLLSEIRSFESIPSTDIYSLAHLYIQLGLTSQGLELLQNLRAMQIKGNAELDKAWMLLSVADGRIEQVIEWVEKQPFLNLPLITDAYYVAMDQKQAFLAIHFALLLLDKHPSKRHQAMLANAFVLNGQEEAAIPILQELYAGGAPVVNDYLSALAAANKREGRYQDQLRQLAMAKLRTPGLSNQDKRELGYLLADSGLIQDAIPIFLELAAKKPFENEDVQSLLALWGDKPSPAALDWMAERLKRARETEKAQWIKHLVDVGQPQLAIQLIGPDDLQNRAVQSAYVNALTTYLYLLADQAKQDPGYREELRRMALLQLEFPLSNERKRELGYVLLEQKFKEDASKIFLNLAQKQPFKNPDVQALLGIWGERPTAEQTDWIAGRAKESQGNEKIKWLNYLIDSHSPDRVAALVSSEDLKDDKLFDIALKALNASKKHKEAGELIVSVLSFETRIGRLFKLAKKAQEEGQLDAVQEVYLAILARDIHNAEALKKLAQLLFGRGQYAQAKFYFLAYFQAYPPGDYLSIYQYGDLIQQEKKSRQAKRLYAYALYLLNQETKQDFETEQIKAQLLYKLDYICQAIKIYRDLIEEQPFNKVLRAEFANLLIDIAEYREAATVLCEGFAFRNSRFPKKEEAVPEGPIYLKTAQIRLMQETARFSLALCLSEQALNEHPCFPTVLSAAANVELAMGRWRRALGFLHAAHLTDPLHEVYPQAQREILLDYLPFVQVGGEYRKTGALQREKFRRLQAETYIFPFTKLILINEQDHIKVDLFTFSNGITGPFKGMRERGEVGLLHYFESGEILRGSLYYGTKAAGAGLAYSYLDTYGRWELAIDYHRPFWEFVQTTVESGTVDRMRIFRSARWLPRLESYLAGSLNLYNLRTVSSAASSYRIEGGLSYTWPSNHQFARWLGDDSTLSFVYALDAEYAISIKEKFTPTIIVDGVVTEEGLIFQPLPLDNREDHVLSIFFSKRFSPYILVEGYAGYLYNRAAKFVGNQGDGNQVIDQVPVVVNTETAGQNNNEAGEVLAPVYGISLFVGPKDGLQLHLEYSHGSSIQNNGAVDRYIADLRYAF